MPFRIVVVLIGAVLTAIGAAVYPYFGLLTLLFLTFGRPQDDRPNIAVLHIPMLMLVVVVVGMVARIGTSAPALFAAVKRLRIMLALYALMAFSTLAHSTLLSKNRLFDFSSLICLCIITLALVTTEKRLRGYVLVILASGAYFIVRTLRNPGQITEQIGGQQFQRMAMGNGTMSFGGTNYLALFMVLIIFLSFTLISYYRSLWQRAILFAMMGSAGYIFFKANSRGASFGLAVGMLALWLMQKRKMKGLVIALVIVITAALLAPQAYWDRLSTVARYEEDASATDRLALWDIALGLVAENPVLGVGPDNFTLYAPNTPHNAYLQIASEVGLPALFLYISILGSGLLSAWRARGLCRDFPDKSYLYAISQGFFCCQMAVVIQGFTTGLAHREVVYVFVTMGICVLNLAEMTSNDSQKLESLPVEHNTLQGEAHILESVDLVPGPQDRPIH